MAYNLLELPVNGYQEGGQVGGLSGRLKAMFTKGTDTLRHNISIEDALDALTKKTKKTEGWLGTAANLVEGLGTAASIGSMFIPGVRELSLLKQALLATGAKGVTKLLGSTAVDAFAPDVVTPKDIIDRQGIREGEPLMGVGDWRKIEEGYGDLEQFRNRAGLKMRQGTLAQMPVDFLKNYGTSYMMGKMGVYDSGLEDVTSTSLTAPQRALGGGKLSLDLTGGTGGTFTSPSSYSPFEGSLSWAEPNIDVTSTSVASPEMGAYGSQQQTTNWLQNIFPFLRGIGYQDGGLVFEGDVPSFGDILSDLDVALPPGYEDWRYEYDPGHEKFLSEEFGRKKEGYEAAGEEAIGGAYSNLLSGFRDISEQGKAALTKARTGAKGGFAGGGNLLDMNIQDLYSGAAARRGSALGDYERFEDFKTGETERLIGSAEAGAREDVRLGREDWQERALSQIMDIQDMYGKPLEDYWSYRPPGAKYRPYLLDETE